jgi:antitoxin component YwqK of YwqJK toxin-antitoxin module
MTDEQAARPGGLSDDEKAELLRLQLRQVFENQRFMDALTGGLLTAVLCAVLWAMITVASKTQIGIMAIGIGFAVGFAVRRFGRGVTRRFAVLGAALSLAACIGGNLLTVVGLIAEEAGIGYFHVLSSIGLAGLLSAMAGSLDAYDVLFYLLAVYTGYRYSRMKVPIEGLLIPERYLAPLDTRTRRIRGAFLIGGTVLLAAVLYGLRFTGSGEVTYRYDSGAVHAVGNMRQGEPDGPWKYWYETGELLAERNWDNGRFDGPSANYYRDGTIEDSSTYRAGLLHGPTASYYPDGTMSAGGEFHNGRQHGVWTGWDENGAMISRFCFCRGALDSAYTEWHPNGAKRHEGRYEDGEQVGIWSTWDENGTLIEQSRFSGDTTFTLFLRDPSGEILVSEGEGTYRSRYPNGGIELEGAVRNGLHRGVWREWYENGALMKEFTCACEPETIIAYWDRWGTQRIFDGTGEYVAFYADSTPLIEGYYADGLKSGEFRVYNTDGTLSLLQTYRRGLLHGPQTVWYDSGGMKVTGEYENGRKSGSWTWYHEDGTKSSTVQYVDGEKQGRQMHWDEFGTLVLEEQYENGVLVGEKIL